MAADVVLHFQPCSTCGRTFNPDSLARHKVICEKNSSKQRKPFDTKKQRLLGTGLEHFQHLSSSQHVQKSNMAAQKKANWRKKHEEFINSIRSARNYTSGDAPPLPTAPNPDYVPCPYCQRRFEPTTAERHVPFCKEQASRLDRKPSSGIKGLDSLNKRISYKPPPLKKKSEPGSRNTPSKPPGSSIVMQNTNFKNTYTIDQSLNTPTNQPGLPPSRPRVHKGDTITKKPHPAAPGSRNLTTGTSPQARNGMAKQKTKTTSFSRIKREVHNSSPLSNDGSNNGNYKSSATPNSTHYSVMDSNGVQNSAPSYGITDKPLERLRISASQRLFAALEYSDQSSDEGSSHFGDGDKGVRGRHLTHTLNNDRYSEERYTMENIPSAHRITTSTHGGMVMSATHDQDTLATNNVLRQNSGQTISSNSSSAGSHKRDTSRTGVPLNEFGIPMSKFCYECGTKFPVPQAKYCCECGTKRI